MKSESDKNASEGAERKNGGNMMEKELLGAGDVAALMGVKKTTVWRWCQEGKLPCLKVGQHWRVRRGP